MQANMRNPGLLGRDLVSLLFLVLLPGVLCAEGARPTGNTATETRTVSYSNLYVKVQLDNRVKPSRLKPGDVVSGRLSQSVYSRDQELFPAGSRVRLVVDKLERRRRPLNDHWPWVIKAFTPRHEKYPTFQSATVLLANGSEVSLRVSLVSIGQEAEVHAEPAKQESGQYPDSPGTTQGSSSGLPSSSKKKKAPKTPRPAHTANFEAVVLRGEEFSADPHGPTPASSGKTVTVAVGTEAKVILLGSVSASKSHPGDSFQARLVEPVYVGHTVALPEGSVFEGTVMKSTGPRMLSRSGSVLLSFKAVTSPGGTREPIATSIAGLELDLRSHMRVDPEGQLKGDRSGKAWLMTNLGVTGGVAKGVDDGMQLLIEAIVSSATDVSTAGSARMAAACASGLFMLTRHGRDVVLPKFTEMRVVFNRPVSLSATQPVPIATEQAGQTQSSTMEQ